MCNIFLKQTYTWDEKVKKIIIYKSIIFSMILLVLQVSFFIYLSIYNENSKYLYNIIWGILLFIIYIIIKYFYTQKIFENYSYTISNDEIIIQSGFLIKNKYYIPYNIIQNISINKGPIMNKFCYENIYIKIITGEKTIHYVNKENSEKLKQKIIENKNRYKLKY